MGTRVNSELTGCTATGNKDTAEGEIRGIETRRRTRTVHSMGVSGRTVITWRNVYAFRQMAKVEVPAGKKGNVTLRLIKD